MIDPDDCRNCDGTGFEPFLETATGGPVPCQTCAGHEDPPDGDDLPEDWSLPDDDTDEPEGYQPEAAALYDGTPESGTIVDGSRVLP